MGVAADPYIAAEAMEFEIPDVITLDVEMPRMDGLTFLEKIMTQHPIPVVMCSSLTDEGCATALRAMDYGAVTIITKPKIGVKAFLEESRITICDAIKAAASVRPRRLIAHPRLAERKLSADVVLAKGDQSFDDLDHGEGGGHRRLDRRHNGYQGRTDSAARGCPWHCDRAAYAGEVHGLVRRCARS